MPYGVTTRVGARTGVAGVVRRVAVKQSQRFRGFGARSGARKGAKSNMGVGDTLRTVGHGTSGALKKRQGKASGQDKMIVPAKLKAQIKEVVRADMAVKNTFLISQSVRVTTAINNQSIALVGDIGSVVDLQNIGVFVASTACQEYLVQRMQSIIQFTNQSTGNVFVKLYLCQCRKNWDAGDSSIASGIALGFSSPSTTTNRISASSPGASFYQCTKMVQKFKILDTYEYCMGAGETKSEKYTHKPKMLRQKQDTGVSTSLYIKDYSFIWIAEILSAPYNDTVTVTKVNLAQNAIDFITYNTYHYSSEADSQQSTNYTYGLTDLITAGQIHEATDAATVAGVE